MAELTANGIRIHYEAAGEGPPLVLVHGSWVDSSSWAGLVPLLADSFRVVAYDRRGHSRSERPAGQGSVREDADDLGALIEALDLGPAHVVASSYGGNIALRLATRRPELFQSLTAHEPPMVGVLAGDAEGEALAAAAMGSFEAVARRIATGDHAGAARQFVEEVALGPGAWAQFPPVARELMVHNAPTFLDEFRDPDQGAVDPDALAEVEVPVLISNGSAGSALFARIADGVADLIPSASRATILGAAHAPHLDVPEGYAATIRAAALSRIPLPA